MPMISLTKSNPGLQDLFGNVEQCEEQVQHDNHDDHEDYYGPVSLGVEIGSAGLETNEETRSLAMTPANKQPDFQAPPSSDFEHTHTSSIETSLGVISRLT